MFDGFTTSTSTCYAIYVSADGKVGQENKIINNIVYSMSGNGTQYGIYNTSGDSMLVYHNTIVLDGTSTTGNTYGFYQTGAAAGIQFKNNVLYITRSGTGIKELFSL